MKSIYKNISLEEISKVLKNARKKGFIDEFDDSVIFIDLKRLRERVTYVQKCFPKDSNHTVAIKTNPLVKVLREFVDSGAGLEAASIGEIKLALAAGVNPKKIVFDSPAKTIEDLKMCLNLGIHINIDNLEELKRLEEINPINFKSTIGIRINPQIGVGKIQALSTAGTYSKFGIPIKYEKNTIIDAFKKNTWLTCLHVHSGSKGLEPEQLTLGIQTIYNLAEEINEILSKENRPNQVKTIDIGGGFSHDLTNNGKVFTMNDYVSQIERECPNLFKKYKIVSEYGRFYNTPAGWVASKVEYVKSQPEKNTAIIHVGANLFLRECYTPNDTHHEISILNSKYEQKIPTSENEGTKWNIAGPLCFEGDVLGRDLTLPKLVSGDFVIIHETGGNTINMWNRHCSRLIPKIIGYSNSDNFEILRQREEYEDLVRFWGG